MPITPFHFGPGALAHAGAPKQISFLSFCAANILLDFEPLYFMYTQQYPLHRFFHSYIGATVVILGTLVLFATALKLARALPNVFDWKKLSYSSVAIGAALGAYSHIVFDSIMHSDIHPLLPFSAHNDLFRLISISSLHIMCIGLGLAGLFILGLRKHFTQRRQL